MGREAGVPYDADKPASLTSGRGEGTWRATVLTLFPGMFPGPLGVSLAGRALEHGIWSLDVRDIRAAAAGRHRTVDDTPFGGGAGMVMRPDVLDTAIGALDGPLIYLSPRGAPLRQGPRPLAGRRARRDSHLWPL